MICSTHFRKNLPDVVTLPQVFQKNGYFVARAGKIYHYGNPGDIGTPGLDDPPSWNETVNPAGVDHTKEEPLVEFLTPGRGGPGAQGAREGTGRPGGEGSPQGPRGVAAGRAGRGPMLGAAIAEHRSEYSEDQHTDYLVADAIISMMEKHRNEAWFLGSGFYKPHVPWIVPSKYFDLYNVNDMDVPPFDESEMKIAPHWAYTGRTPNMGMSLAQHREAIRAYYAATAFLDVQVGRVVDAVERLGLKSNTSIVFWADHGWQLGEHGQWQKNTLFEPSVRVPLMMAGAGVRSRGKACPRTVEHLDIYPTLVELCGLQGAPVGLHGQSLVPWLANPTAARNRPAISQQNRGQVMGYSLRTEQYRYTMWKEGAEGEELYDYHTDSRELRNLADDRASAPLKARLRAGLERIARARGMPEADGSAGASRAQDP